MAEIGCLANLPQEYQPPLISDCNRWYSEDPIPIIYIIERQSERQVASPIDPQVDQGDGFSLADGSASPGGV